VARIPYICKFKPGIPGISPVGEEEKVEEEQVEEEQKEAENPDLDNGEEMYGLSVELRQEGRQGAQLLNTKSDSAPVGTLFRSSRAIPRAPFSISEVKMKPSARGGRCSEKNLCTEDIVKEEEKRDMM
jgi:hypothetical protein